MEHLPKSRPETIPCPDCGMPFLKENYKDGTPVVRCFGCTVQKSGSPSWKKS